ncbi:hypothetical protein TcasGA2_TC006912 [Tribolium castaneum]|uniref:Uncharacterized protein n=1 Tax=Tribolium castaneum TaxID=7070 RepID=D7ELM1_TRICA|nr:hypothetical protein TcasGA2_TC006912 [Tribolium castaneum]
MSLIHIRSKENDFEISYSENPINLSGLKGKIALKTASLWYSWDNITEEYKNNEIKFRRSPHELSEYKSGKKAPQTELKNNEIKKDRQGLPRVEDEEDDRNESEWKILKLPNGLYDENELNNYIQEYFGTFETPPFYFDVNYATNRFMLIIRDKDYEIDFSHGKIHELLGFDKKIYSRRPKAASAAAKEGINYATKIGNITKDIDQILIHCSLVSSSYQNNLKSDVIYAFTPNISPRSLINIEPTHPKYLPINRTDYIFNIRISVTNQLNQLINFNGECLNFVLDIQ